MHFKYYFDYLSGLVDETPYNKFWDNPNNNILHILCYHVNSQGKYPFVQVLITKIPYCNNLVTEKFIMPYIIIQDRNVETIKMNVIEYVRNELKSIGCDYDKVNEDMFKGYVREIHTTDKIQLLAVMDISSIDIGGLLLLRNYSSWFLLPTEIQHDWGVFGITIDDDLVELFIKHREYGLIIDLITNESYMLPNAVYTGSELKKAEFYSIFGNCKSKKYPTAGEYYYFYGNYVNAIKDGGWIQDKNATKKIGDRILVDNSGKKYLNGAINRYAMFFPANNSYYISPTTRDDINFVGYKIDEHMAKESCLWILYVSPTQFSRENVVCKNYKSFVSLSYHKLDYNLLGDEYSPNNKLPQIVIK